VSNQLQRVLFAAIAIPLALGIVWYGGLLLALLVAAAAALGTGELLALSAKAGVRPLRGLAVTLAVLAPLGTWVLAGAPAPGDGSPADGMLGLIGRIPLWLFAQWPLAGALVPLLVLGAVLLRRGAAERPLEVAAVSLFAPLYCGVLPSAILLIRYAAGGERSWAATWLVFFPLAVTWLCDSFAMWGGTLIGGPKLAPAISPGKTRAGAVTGLVGGVVTAVAYVPLALAPVGRAFPLARAAVMGLVIACVAQIGDLAESLFKREAGVKDSSGLIPGHGGVLDRFDSLYFVLPTSALLFRAFGVI
jgi:phosphatidate cytidylyltransferase